MKATCQHGRPWFGPCLACDWRDPEPVPEIPFWRTLTPLQAQRVAEGIMANVFAETYGQLTRRD